MTDAHHAVTPASIPWVPLREGLSMRPLHFEEDGYSLQLRLEPGTVISRHRHTGVTHALNLSGSRRIDASGEVIGPGDFIFEPAGNEDSWRCHGDEQCIVQISLTGRVEYLDEQGRMVDHSDTHTAKAAYLAHCRVLGINPDRRIVADVAASPAPVGADACAG